MNKTVNINVTPKFKPGDQIEYSWTAYSVGTVETIWKPGIIGCVSEISYKPNRKPQIIVKYSIADKHGEVLHGNFYEENLRPPKTIQSVVDFLRNQQIPLCGYYGSAQEYSRDYWATTFLQEMREGGIL